MKKVYLLFLLLFCLAIHFSNAQTTFTTSTGISFHGSGDLGGYAVSFGIEKPLKNRFFLNINTRFTTHSGQYELYIEDNGQIYNSSYRQVTAGTQLEILPTFILVKSNSFNLRLHLGVIGRYQVSNNYSDVIFLYPAITNFQYPLITLNAGDDDRFKQLSIGYLAQLSTQFKISEKSKLGLSLVMQNDNEGDLIWSLPINYYFTF